MTISTTKEFAAARHQLGLSVSQCAAICAVEPRTVRRWEDGTRPPAPSACRIMEIAMARGIKAVTVRPTKHQEDEK